MTSFQSIIFNQYRFNQYRFNQYYQALATQTGRLQTDRFQCHLLAQTDSTNRVAWEILTQPDHSGIILVIADSQTAGRGQWGRSWQSEPGGLYLSLGMRDNPKTPMPLDRLGLMPFFSAWGVAQGLHKHHIPVLLKWPNDLLLNRQKLGGILVETRYGSSTRNQPDFSSPDSRLGLVIGIGLNWQNHPPEQAIALNPYQQENNLKSIEGLEHLAAIVLDGLMGGYQLASSADTSVVDFIEQYNTILANRGAWISTGSEVGKILGITATGALRVEVNGVEQVFLPGTLRLGL
mgnify:CR=1 FL=1|jgi:BirA family transcriptional regulator, biotin operon repressor / biotin---[acetyl-CoA-carboxylase] ligase